MKKHDDSGLEVLVGCVAILCIIIVAVLLGGLFFWLAWNLGVVGVVAAAGGSVGKISFWTGVGATLAVGILARILHGRTATTTN